MSLLSKQRGIAALVDRVVSMVIWLLTAAPPPPPNILQNLCFSFILGITAVPREIENNAYTSFIFFWRGGGVGGGGDEGRKQGA